MSTKEHSHTQTQNESPRDPLQKVILRPKYRTSREQAQQQKEREREKERLIEIERLKEIEAQKERERLELQELQKQNKKENLDEIVHNEGQNSLQPISKIPMLICITFLIVSFLFLTIVLGLKLRVRSRGNERNNLYILAHHLFFFNVRLQTLEECWK